MRSPNDTVTLNGLADGACMPALFFQRAPWYGCTVNAKRPAQRSTSELLHHDDRRQYEGLRSDLSTAPRPCPVWLGNEACNLAHRTAALQHCMTLQPIPRFHQSPGGTLRLLWLPRPNNLRLRPDIASSHRILHPSQFTIYYGIWYCLRSLASQQANKPTTLNPSFTYTLNREIPPTCGLNYHDWIIPISKLCLARR